MAATWLKTPALQGSDKGDLRGSLPPPHRVVLTGGGPRSQNCSSALGPVRGTLPLPWVPGAFCPRGLLCQGCFPKGGANWKSLEESDSGPCLQAAILL